MHRHAYLMHARVWKILNGPPYGRNSRAYIQYVEVLIWAETWFVIIKPRLVNSGYTVHTLHPTAGLYRRLGMNGAIWHAHAVIKDKCMPANIYTRRV